MTEEIQKELAKHKAKRTRQTFFNAFMIVGVISLGIGILLLLGDRDERNEANARQDAAITQFQSALKRICVESDKEIDELSPDVQDDCRRAVRNQPPAPVQEVLEGPEGPTGPVGPIGPEGPIGPAGPLGPRGPAGPEGDEGPQGIQGLRGLLGLTGPVGPIGEQGPIGPTGEAGPAGPQGEAGPQGPQGEPGNTGAKGDPGENGPTPVSARFERNDDGQCVYVLVFSNEAEISTVVPGRFCIGVE